MKQLLVLLILVFSFVCEGQTTKVDYYEDINYKDIVELKGLLYLKADTTLVTGRVIRYNRKNEAKRYILVVNGIPDKSGWINTREDKFIEPKESALGSVVASMWIHRATMEVTGNAINIPFPTYSMYQEYNKEKISKAHSDMSDRNEISKKLNSEKETINRPFEEHYEDGKLEIKENYIDKKKDGVWEEYYVNSQLKSRGNFIEGKEDGLWVKYHENGQLLNQGNYINGRKTAEWKTYHKNGKLKEIGSYKNGKEDGLWEEYNEQGELIAKITYRFSIKIKIENFD